MIANGENHGSSSDELLHDALAAADELDFIGQVTVGEAIRDDSGRIVDFRILAVNRQTAAFLRREPADLVGGTWSELFPGLLEHPTFDYVVRVVETGEPVWVAPASRSAQQTVSGASTVLEAHFGRFRDGYICIASDVTDRYGATEALSEVKDRYERMLATAQEGVLVIDEAGVVTMMNDAGALMLGVDPADVVGQPALDVFTPGMSAEQKTFVQQRLRDRMLSGARYEFPYPRADGSVALLWVSSTPAFRDDGSFEASITFLSDVTALREAEQRYRLLADNSTDVIRICNSDDMVTYLSPASRSVLGYAPEEVVGRRWQEFLHPEDVPAYVEMLRDLGSHPETFLRQARFRRADGVTIWLESALRQVRDQQTGALVELQGSSRDVTQRVLAMQALEESEERYRHRAVHDPLTALPNRQLLFDRLTHALEMSQRSQSLVAVLFIDVDNFKYINDSLGHELGDRMLVEVAQRVTAAARSGDTVARFGGDEFVIVCEGVTSESAAVNVAERVSALLHQSLQVDGHRLRITVSVGIAMSAAGQPTAPGDLLRNADLAMYRAKQRGRNRWEVFDASLSADAVRRLRVETELRDALELGQLLVHYQPIADLRTGGLTGVEALVRWDHPTRGVLLPDDFLDIAEETGLIVAIGSQVLHRACRDVAGWLREQRHSPITVAVNVSIRQLAWGDFTAVIDQALAESGIEPSLLHLELTETALFDATRTSPTDLAAIDRLGVAIGIDDFGTGYSSLAYLKRFPVRFLKVDKSFVDGLGVDPEDTAIVEAIVNLGLSLGLDVIAEGVETAEQLAALRELGCTSAQGYLIARPAPFDELRGLLANGSEPADRP